MVLTLGGFDWTGAGTDACGWGHGETRTVLWKGSDVLAEMKLLSVCGVTHVGALHVFVHLVCEEEKKE